MRWDTRIVVLAGLLLVVAAAWYFRVFQPASSAVGIPIDFGEYPAESTSPILTPARPIAREMPSPSRPPAKVAKPITSAAEPRASKPSVRDKEAQGAQPRTYTVKAGDSLWTIARDQLGEPARHVELLELNESTLYGDPDNLSPGQKLILPSK